jgi:hypothetical protein
MHIKLYFKITYFIWSVKFEVITGGEYEEYFFYPKSDAVYFSKKVATFRINLLKAVFSAEKSAVKTEALHYYEYLLPLYHIIYHII